MIENQLQLVGLDLGRARCGLAVADPAGRLALPLAVLPTEPQASLAERIAQALAGRRIQAVVAGLPLDRRGAEGESAQWARALATRLAAELQVPVEFVDERYSSVLHQPRYASGKRAAARKVRNLDALAAAEILQTYLNRPIAGPD